MSGRTRLPPELKDKVLLANTKALVPLSFAAKMFGVSETTIRNWNIVEKYPDYEPVVYGLYDVFNAYEERNAKKTLSLKRKIDDLKSNTIDWAQSLKKEQTKTAELKNSQLELKLIEYAPLQYYLLNITQRFAATIDDIPSRLSPKVIGCKDRQEAYLLLKDEMRIVKNALADISLDAYKSKPIGIEEENPNGFIYDEHTDTFVREGSITQNQKEE